MSAYWLWVCYSGGCILHMLSVDPGRTAAQWAQSVLVPILGTRGRGIYCGERQSERRVMSRERYQNVVGAASNKCRGWKVLGTKGSGSYNTAASVQSPQTGLCPPPPAKHLLSHQCYASCYKRMYSRQSALCALFYMALNAARSISVVYCCSIKFYLVKVMIYLLHLAE